MLSAWDFRMKGRDALSGCWGVAVLTGFVASLLGAYTAAFNIIIDITKMDSEDVLFLRMLPPQLAFSIIKVLAVVGTVMLLLNIVQLVLGGPISLGYAGINLDMVNGYVPRFSDLFSQFDRFKNALCMHLLRIIYVLLWSLLLVVPGILAMLNYAMAPYIMYENSEMTADEALRESKKLMYGNRWRLFCLGFSFIGWIILSVFTLGIGLLWVNPYMQASYAAFYLEIKREKQGIDSLEV